MSDGDMLMQKPGSVVASAMRDIRGDLQERVGLLQEEIAAAGDDYEKAVQRLQSELKARLAALSTAMLADHYRVFLADFLESDRIR